MYVLVQLQILDWVLLHVRAYTSPLYFPLGKKSFSLEQQRFCRVGFLRERERERKERERERRERERERERE